jgi:hypothetical protein
VCTDIPGTVALQHPANVEVRYGEPCTRARRGGDPELDTGSRLHQRSDKGVARMFGLFNGMKYRNEMTGQIHSILMLVLTSKALPLHSRMQSMNIENRTRHK